MIYLDHNATTPLDPEVLEAMRPHFLTPGNTESRHSAGRRARRVWESARETVARILGAEPDEVIFTSGGTEANNLGIFGLAGIETGPGHLVCCPIEHPSVAEPVGQLEVDGFIVDRVSVDTEGLANVERMAERFTERTRLATLMLANNETGSIQPVRQLAGLAIPHGIPVHTDAVQAVGRIPVDFGALEVATLAASAHKFHGPVGVGILLVRRGVKFRSRLHGGNQQRGQRPGTIAVPLAVGLASALERWQIEAKARTERWVALCSRLERDLISALGPEQVVRNGPATPELRLPQTINLGFADLDGDALLIQLDLEGIAVSLGAACASGSARPSPTLIAMHVPSERLRSSVRFSLGASTTEAEIDQTVARIVRAIARIRGRI